MKPLALALLLGVAAGAQTHRGRARLAPPPRPNFDAVQSLLRRGEFDLRAHSYEDAARDYEAVLRLDPANAAARAGLDHARFGACHDVALQEAGGGDFAAAAVQWQRCATWQPPTEESQRQLDALRQLAAVAGALAANDQGGAAAALRQLAALGAPPPLPDTLAPAYVRFASGDAAGAMQLADALAGRVPAQALAANRFEAFVRTSRRGRAWRMDLLALLALYALALPLSLAWGLRVLERERAAGELPASGAAPAA